MNEVVEVSLVKMNGTLIKSIKTFPSNMIENCQKYVVNSTHVSNDTARFERLVSKLGTLENIDYQVRNKFGYDGSYWSIEYGDKVLKTKYTFWSPTSSTMEERGLYQFVELSEEIMELAEFDKSRLK